MLPYVSSYRTSLADVGWLMLAALVGATVAGALVNVIGQYARVVIVFPVIMGAIVGMVGRAVISRRRIQAPVLAAVMGVLGGLLAFSADHLFDYLRSRQTIAQEMVRVTERLGGDGEMLRSHANLDAVIDWNMVRQGRGDAVNIINLLALVEDESVAGDSAVGTLAALRGWIALRKRQGVSISGITRGRLQKTGPRSTALYWNVAAMLVGGIAGWLFFKAAREPVCEHCNQWYLPSAGRLPAANLAFRDQVRQALELHDDEALASLFPGRGIDRHHLAIEFRRCSHCADAPVYAELQEVRRRPGGYASVACVLRGLAPTEVAQNITQALQTAHRHQREEAIRKVVRPKHQHRR